ncbi:MAG: OmpH family outer membrane protein [Candidatus Lindowbacteria bacterium]|nr:OmpH family outer membrane protein [Candidatus Lindowbacteria bacterium]
MKQNCLQRRAAALVFIVTAAFLIAIPLSRAAGEQMKVGYIDLDRLVEAVAKQTPEYDELNKELEKRETEIEKRRAEIDKLEEELKANRTIWSEEKTKEQEKTLRDKVDDLKVYSEGAQRFRDVEENKILRRLLPDIAKSVRKVGERDGYSMIFERRILLYGAPGLDLTDIMIKEMSEKKAQ